MAFLRRKKQMCNTNGCNGFLIELNEVSYCKKCRAIYPKNMKRSEYMKLIGKLSEKKLEEQEEIESIREFTEEVNNPQAIEIIA